MRLSASSMKSCNCNVVHKAILWNRIDLPAGMNTEVIPIEQGPDVYAKYSAGSAKKFVIDPNGMLKE